MPATFTFDAALLAPGCATADPSVRLKPLTAADADAMAAGLDDLDVSRNLVAVPHPYGATDAQAFVSGHGASPHILCAAVMVEGAFAGCVAIDALNGPPELGYWLTKAHWGRGIATLATRALVDLAFSATTIASLTSGHFVDNAASAAVLAKLGFRKKGIGAQHSRARAETVELVAMTLDRSRWSATQPLIETSRLEMRPPTLADVDEIALMSADRSLGLMTAAIPKPFTVEDARAFVASAARRSRPAAMTFSIRRTSDRTLVGGIGWTSGESGLVELGYWLGVEHRGRGLATEAARAVLDAAFGWTEAQAVTARCRVTNPASRGVLERCGFQWEGTGLVRSPGAPGSVAVDVFRLDRDVFASLKEWGQSAARNGAARATETPPAA